MPDNAVGLSAWSLGASNTQLHLFSQPFSAAWQTCGRHVAVTSQLKIMQLPVCGADCQWAVNK